MVFWTKFSGAAHGFASFAERCCAYHTAASSEKKPGGKRVFGGRNWQVCVNDAFITSSRICVAASRQPISVSLRISPRLALDAL